MASICRAPNLGSAGRPPLSFGVCDPTEPIIRPATVMRHGKYEQAININRIDAGVTKLPESADCGCPAKFREPIRETVRYKTQLYEPPRGSGGPAHEIEVRGSRPHRGFILGGFVILDGFSTQQFFRLHHYVFRSNCLCAARPILSQTPPCFLRPKVLCFFFAQFIQARQERIRQRPRAIARLRTRF